jgi:hypothetical protein
MWTFTIQRGTIPPSKPCVELRAHVKRGKLLENRSFMQLTYAREIIANMKRHISDNQQVSQ